MMQSHNYYQLVKLAHEERLRQAERARLVQAARRARPAPAGGGWLASLWRRWRRPAPGHAGPTPSRSAIAPARPVCREPEPPSRALRA